MRRIAEFLGLVAALAVGTWFIAWWAVPLVAAAWGRWRRDEPGAPVVAGIGGLVAWAVLVWVSSRGAPAGSVMQTVGSALQVGPGALLGLTLAFPALLAASAAAIARASRPSSGGTPD